MREWIEVYEDDPNTFPKADEYVLLSFANFPCPLVGRCEGNEEKGFNFYIGDNTESCISLGIIVNGWMKLPKCLEG